MTDLSQSPEYEKVYDKLIVEKTHEILSDIEWIRDMLCNYDELIVDISSWLRGDDDSVWTVRRFLYQRATQSAKRKIDYGRVIETMEGTESDRRRDEES